MTAQPPTNPPRDTSTGFWFVHEPNFKYVVGGIIIAAGVLLFLGFFIFPWYAPNVDNVKDDIENKLDSSDAYVEEYADDRRIDEDDARDELLDSVEFVFDDRDSRTAWQIWTGSDEDAILRVDEDYEIGKDGFGEVDSRDRLLILIPLLALGLVGVSVAYVMDRLDQRTALIAIIVISLLLLILPLLWIGLKNSYISGSFTDQAGDLGYSSEAEDQAVDLVVVLYSSPFSTFKFVFLSFLALMLSAGTYFIMGTEHRRLGTNWPAPMLRMARTPPAGTPPPPPMT